MSSDCTRKINRSFAALLVVVAIGAISGGCKREADRQKFVPPNVLLISLCSVRTDHMSLYHYERETTPNLDRFAAEAFVFENAISQWPKTAPAFAALMTGKYGYFRISQQLETGSGS